MNYLEEVKKNMNILIKCLDECKNDRIKQSVAGTFPRLAEEFQKLDQQEDDLNTKMPFLEKLIKLRSFAETKGNLDNVWKYLHMNKYQKQDQFIEVLRDLPLFIEQSREQQTISISTFLKQSCAELYSHQLVTFNLRVVENNQIKASDDEQEQNCGCITYVSPEVENTRLFKISMNLPGLMNKVKKLNALLPKPEQDQYILNLTLDNNSRRATVWSTEETVGFYITKRPYPEGQSEMEQIIYLETGMVIQLTKTFSLKVLWATNIKDAVVNDNLNPIKLRKTNQQDDPQDPNKPVLQNPDYYITFASQFEQATFYPTKNPIKIGEHLQLPSGYELLLYHDGVGHYVEVIQNLNNFTSFVKSRKLDNKLLQFITNKIDFNIRLVLEQKVNFQISTNLQVVWDGKDLFDL